jgi:hypothetical protein
MMRELPECALAAQHTCHKAEDGRCPVYSPPGVELRVRVGYCPVADVPKKVVAKKDGKRVGQQKQKKGK